MRLLILILLGLAYVLNSVVLGWVYPDASIDRDQYDAFIHARNIVYDFMFGAFFLLVYLLSTKASKKAVACFFLVLAFSSAIDKCLGITWYLKSDVLLVAVSLGISIYVYVREHKR